MGLFEGTLVRAPGVPRDVELGTRLGPGLESERQCPVTSLATLFTSLGGQHDGNHAHQADVDSVRGLGGGRTGLTTSQDNKGTGCVELVWHGT